MSATLRLADLLAGLSIACDLGFGLPPEEAMRSCLIATGLARRLGLPEAEVADTYYTALLMHVGCSALSHETAAVFGDERPVLTAVAGTNVADPADVSENLMPVLLQAERPAVRAQIEHFAATDQGEFGRNFDTGSCEIASATARRVGLGKGAERALKEAVEWWNGEGPPQGLKGDEIAPAARVARAAADAARFEALGGKDAVVRAVKARSGAILDPAVVATLIENADELLAETRAGDPRERVLEIEPAPVAETDFTELTELARAFGDLADMKMPWTHGHSGGVAKLACAAAESLKLDAQTSSRLEVSALFADLGKVAVSNAIWEKPGPLTGGEWEQVRMHSYHSERILARSETLAPMARVAGMHHERLDGSGYFRGCAGKELPLAARILGAADAFHAMTQPRPHRAARSGEEAAAELQREVRAGRIDRDAAAAVIEAAGGARPKKRANLRPGGLSEREVEVAQLVAAGLSNAQVAEKLVISRRTAEHHVQNIYAKVGVASRVGLAFFAHEHELIDPR
ncbi:MAG: LuxR C-terminal-related transcriptional regulator [Actinomycetota bacterium]|nr:LuxR C-terminal-related transcriptional regulator [Actinomycetota bacterium]